MLNKGGGWARGFRIGWFGFGYLWEWAISGNGLVLGGAVSSQPSRAPTDQSALRYRKGATRLLCRGCSRAAEPAQSKELSHTPGLNP